MSRSNDFSQRVPLGRTGIEVSRLGIGSSYGVSRRACRAAFDAGVNYFFWGSVRTRGMALAIRDLAPSHRDELVVVLQCYVRFASLIPRSIKKGLAILGLDYADVLVLGWHERRPSPRILDVVERERQRGRFRFLGISSHHRRLFPRLVEDGRYDVFQLRYSAAHPGAEQDIFPHLPESGRPGTASFTCTRWGDLLNPKKMPTGEVPLTAADCYRFALSNPYIDVAICGPGNDDETTQALSVLQSGPMGEQELSRARAIGHHVHEQKSLNDWFR